MTARPTIDRSWGALSARGYACLQAMSLRQLAVACPRVGAGRGHAGTGSGG